MSEFVELVHPYCLSMRYFNGAEIVMNVQILSGQENVAEKVNVEP